MGAWIDRLRANRPASALIALGTVVGLVDLGSLLGVWGWLPIHLHSAAASACAALIVVHLLPRHMAAVAESYRLGIRHGRREQRRKCEASCGHVCGDVAAADSTGEIPAVPMPVAVGGTVVALTARRARHRAH